MRRKPLAPRRRVGIDGSMLEFQCCKPSEQSLRQGEAILNLRLVQLPEVPPLRYGRMSANPQRRRYKFSTARWSSAAMPSAAATSPLVAVLFRVHACTASAATGVTPPFAAHLG